MENVHEVFFPFLFFLNTLIGVRFLTKMPRLFFMEPQSFFDLVMIVVILSIFFKNFEFFKVNKLYIYF
jgi:hypothetical protein